MASFMKRNVLIAFMALMMTGALSAAGKSTDAYLSDLKSGSEDAKVEACQALGKAKAKAAVPDLIAALDSDSTQVQAAAAAALGAIGEKGEATVAVLKTAQETDNSVVRYSALAALLQLVEDDKKEDIQQIMNAQTESEDDLLSDLAVKLAAKLEK